MRQRERKRIARKRADYRAATSALRVSEKKLERLGNKGKRGTGRRARDDLRAATLVLYQRAQLARGRLAVAISAPVEAKFHDIRARPQRHTDRSKARALAESIKAKAKILEIRKPDSPRDARAFKQIREAIENGEKPADVYQDIAASTGLSQRMVYWMLTSPDKFGISE